MTDTQSSRHLLARLARTDHAGDIQVGPAIHPLRAEGAGEYGRLDPRICLKELKHSAKGGVAVLGGEDCHRASTCGKDWIMIAPRSLARKASLVRDWGSETSGVDAKQPDPL